MAGPATFTRPSFLRPGPLSSAVLLHLAFFFAMRNGLLQEIERAVPVEVMITLVSPQTATAPKIMSTPVKPAPAIQPQKLTPPPMAPQPVQPAPVAIVPVAVPTPTTVSEHVPAQQAVVPASVAAPAAAPVSPAAPSAPQSIAVTTEHAQPMTVNSVEYVQAPKPDYPIASKRLGEQGKVVLRILINEQGLPERVDIHQATGFARLDEAARQAAMRAVFKPHRENGRAVPVFVMVPVNFSIK
jgi:protein TonB